MLDAVSADIGLGNVPTRQMSAGSGDKELLHPKRVSVSFAELVQGRFRSRTKLRTVPKYLLLSMTMEAKTQSYVANAEMIFGRFITAQPFVHSIVASSMRRLGKKKWRR